MAPEGNGTGLLGTIYNEIMAGDTTSFTTAGAEFKEALDKLKKVAGEIPTEVHKLVGKDWKGTASAGFSGAADKVVEDIGDTAQAVGSPSWQTLLVEARDALKKAQDDIKDLAKQWNDYLSQDPPVTPNKASFDEAAKNVRKTLADVYNAKRQAMKPPAKDLDKADDGADGKGSDDKGADDKGADGSGAGDDKGAGGADGPGAGGADSKGADGPGAGGADSKGSGGADGPGSGGADGPGAGSGGPVVGGPGRDDPLLGSKTGGPDTPGTSNLEFNDSTGQPVLGKPDSPGGPDSPDSPDSPAGGGTDTSGLPRSTLDGADPSTTLTSASSPGGGSGSPGGGAGSPGGGGIAGGTPSQLTSAGPSAGFAGPAGYGLYGPVGGAGRGLVGPGVGAPVSVGRRVADDDEDDERETELLGDEEWDDTGQVAGAVIGRPGQ
jgi:hypothetical protein